MTKPYDSAIKNHPKLWLDALPKLTAETNKYTRGVTTIIGGYPMTGAAKLSALAAARIGSGLTTILVPQVAFAIYANAFTSIMVKPFDDARTFNQLIEDQRVSSFLIGPGAGVSDETRAHTLQLLATKRPVVLDADAITVFRGNSALLIKNLHADCVITPHEGEFKRLFALTEHRVLSAQQAAIDCGAVVVLKGNKTVIAAPDGRTVINENAPPTLATGGSGDVLAGMIVGLMAQGMSSFDAACAAVWMHAQAATLFGLGLIAEDLPSLLPQVLTTLHQQ
jgi:ADP-dependent NAD(P)H-hydrate dehydratase / NAD(P)H-hydrate epimerase